MRCLAPLGILSPVRLPFRHLGIAHWRPGRELNPRVEDLQSPVLPLHHRAVYLLILRVPRQFVETLAVLLTEVEFERDLREVAHAGVRLDVLAELAGIAVQEL